MFAVQAHGHEIVTVEGLGTPDELHPIQEAFWDAHAVQCGFCTPGILLSMVAFLEETSDPTEADIREILGGHLCRCTGYQHIVDAVRQAAEKMRE
jgi:carbon-monoxide dehydrogenase small subunit